MPPIISTRRLYLWRMMVFLPTCLPSLSQKPIRKMKHRLYVNFSLRPYPKVWSILNSHFLLIRHMNKLLQMQLLHTGKLLSLLRLEWVIWCLWKACPLVISLPLLGTWSVSSLIGWSPWKSLLPAYIYIFAFIVSMSFQFVGFMLCYLLHTSHAAKVSQRLSETAW